MHKAAEEYKVVKACAVETKQAHLFLQSVLGVDEDGIKLIETKISTEMWIIRGDLTPGKSTRLQWRSTVSKEAKQERHLTLEPVVKQLRSGGGLTRKRV